MLSVVSSKISLYDILSMIIPGGLLLGSFMIYVGDISIIERLPDWSLIALYLIVSYLLGIVNYQLTELMWSSFRNNPKDIKAWNDAIYSHKPVKYSSIYISVITAEYIIVSFIVFFSLKFEIFFEILCSIVVVIVLILPQYTSLYNRIDKTVLRYYKKYYFVEKNRKVSSISVLESQVSFLKNICLPICVIMDVLLSLPNSTEIDAKWTILVGFVILVIIIRTTSIKQGTIYRIILEDYKYLKEM